jgi:hypothetical protein
MRNRDLGAPPASQDRVTDERSREGASPPSGSVPHGAGAFTPAPWLNYEGDIWDVLEDGCPGVPLYKPDYGIYRRWGRKFQDGEQAANAHLIAAAPELFEALSEAGGYVREIGTPAALACLERVVTALRKARGE